MIEQILDLFQQFKDRKKEKEVTMVSGDRELTGALAIAAAINKLADTITEFKPFVEAAVDAYLSEQTYECGDETFEASTEDVELVRRVLAQVKSENENDEIEADEERMEEKSVFADPLDNSSRSD